MTFRKTLPGRVERIWLGFKTTRRAYREGTSLGDPLVRTGGAECPAFQELLMARLRQNWLQTLASVAAGVFALINARLETLDRQREHLRKAVLEAEKTATEEPKVKVETWMLLAIVLSFILAIITTWSFVETLEWPFPIAALATLGLATFEVAIAGLLGICVYALVKDVPDSPFELNPKEHSFFMAGAVLAGLISVGAIIYLASIRGHGQELVLWIVLGAGIVAISAYCGAAWYDGKFERALASAQNDLEDAETEISTLKNTYDRTKRSVLANGKALGGIASQIHRRAQVAFERGWRRWHRKNRGAVPSLPKFEVPSDTELEILLIVPMYPIDDWKIVEGDVVDARPIEVRRWARRRRQLPPEQPGEAA
jgi:hypothetical protein